MPLQDLLDGALVEKYPKGAFVVQASLSAIISTC